jgi:hypothetical protein
MESAPLLDCAGRIDDVFEHMIGGTVAAHA